MVAIIDYGVGNLFSLKSSLEAIGVESIVTANVEEIEKADKIILPGVGAFGDAINKLKNTGLDKVVINEASKGKKLLGICLGMQLLFDEGYEYGKYTGLGLIPGKVVALENIVPKELKIPQMGWNSLIFKNKTDLFDYINDGDYVYFVHSYYASECDDYVIANTEYGATITAAVQKDNVYGCQFHPEKSGNVGLNILKAFCLEE